MKDRRLANKRARPRARAQSRYLKLKRERERQREQELARERDKRDRGREQRAGKRADGYPTFPFPPQHTGPAQCKSLSKAPTPLLPPSSLLPLFSPSVPPSLRPYLSLPARSAIGRCRGKISALLIRRPLLRCPARPVRSRVAPERLGRVQLGSKRRARRAAGPCSPSGPPPLPSSPPHTCVPHPGQPGIRGPDSEIEI